MWYWYGKVRISEESERENCFKSFVKMKASKRSFKRLNKKRGKR